MAPRPIRILSVDDHRMIHGAIAHLAGGHADMTVVGEATTGEEALDFVDAMKPDVVLMDLNMPGMGGLAATERIGQQFPGVRVIILSGHAQEPYPSRALEAGAAGYLCKDAPEEELLRAIRQVARGQRYISPDVAEVLSRRWLATQGRSGFDGLSEREMAVVLKITSGHGTQEIADLLQISPNTVSSFRRRIFDKVGVKNGVQLTLAAIRHGLLADLLEL